MIIEDFNGSLNGVDLIAKNLTADIEEVNNGVIFKFMCDDFTTEHFIEKECYNLIFGEKEYSSVVLSVLDSISH